MSDDPEAEVRLLIQDEALDVGIGPVETKKLRMTGLDTDRFLDGPTCRRVGIVDFDPATGDPLPAPARFTPYGSGDNPARGRYVTVGLPADDPAFIAVSAFGTVFETIRMFEERGALGRRVEWAFPGEQLLVVPRAGEEANAFYERSTRSLQFFWFDAGGERIYTALSRDIVAHECGHALLDAVVPSLFDSLTPQSMAIHEAVADLVAVLMALRSEKLKSAVLEKTGNSIADASAFSSIADRFGRAKHQGPGPAGALRDLQNDLTIAAAGDEPHQLSTVLSAIFYGSLVSSYQALFDIEACADPQRPELTGKARAGWSLGSAALIFRRLMLRGIDYLPPGEITFADVGRATLAADIAADPTPTPERQAARDDFAQRFVERGVVGDVSDLVTDAPQELRLDPGHVADLHDSDWAAYRFVEDNREKLGIPDATPFLVLPRVDATKEIGVKPAGAEHYPHQRELILKVSWDLLEDNGATNVNARRRRLRTGATVVWSWFDGRVLALIKSDVSETVHRTARDRMLAQMVDAGLVRPFEGAAVGGGQDAPQAPDGGHGDAPGVGLRILGDVARVTGTHRLLHIQGTP